MIGMGMLLAGLLACSTGGQAASGGGEATTAEAPTSEASGGSPLEGLDPCTVLTADDAATVFGAPADPGVPTYAEVSLCRYANAEKTMGLSLEVGYGLDSGEYANSKDSGTQDVPGLGDEAHFNSSHHLVVAKGQWFIVVNGLIDGNPVPLEKLTPLAQTALGRLP